MNTISDKNISVIVAITGASGSIYGHELIKQLRQSPSNINISLVYSPNGKEVSQFECVPLFTAEKGLQVFEHDDMFAPPASGSAGYDAMFIAPCSMGTLGHIASGCTQNLIHRAADVMLKERKPLVLMIREAPLSLIQIENMATITRAGAVVFPASPFFYHHPSDTNDLISALVSRMIATAGLGAPTVIWGKK